MRSEGLHFDAGTYTVTGSVDDGVVMHLIPAAASLLTTNTAPGIIAAGSDITQAAPFAFTFAVPTAGMGARVFNSLGGTYRPAPDGSHARCSSWRRTLCWLTAASCGHNLKQAQPFCGGKPYVCKRCSNVRSCTAAHARTAMQRVHT